jgi:hypothetical protein
MISTLNNTPITKERFTFDEIQNWEALGGIKMTIPDFGEAVKRGEFTDEDGEGYYANDEKVSLVPVVLDEFINPVVNTFDETGNIQLPAKMVRRMSGGTHVVWFRYAKN